MKNEEFCRAGAESAKSILQVSESIEEHVLSLPSESRIGKANGEYFCFRILIDLYLNNHAR